MIFPMKLLIPGPVMTHPSVRAAMAMDYAPWDNDFRAVYAGVFRRLLPIAGGRSDRHAVLPLQGCGHFAVEAAVRTFVPRGEKLLLPMTGAYADRLARLAEEAGRIVVRLPVPARTRTDVEAVTAALEADPAIGHLALVYSETGSGLIHDVPRLAAAAGRLGRRVLVDAVSAFGVLPFDIGELDAVDAISFTSNKALEALPGMSFTISPIDRLDACRGNAGSWSLDLSDVYDHQSGGGTPGARRQMRSTPGAARFTPPAQVVAALAVALDRYEAEGQAARLARYTENKRTLYEGVKALGLTPCLPEHLQGPIIVNVAAPADPAWDLQRFVDALKARGFLISNFYNTPEPSFRVGCIGAIEPADMAAAVGAMEEALDEMGIRERAGTPS
jgi:2-aminoethylphosphonate-pyruvate transaminase